MNNETYYIKIIGKANIPERLEIGHNFKLTADCSITSESKSDNEDGTFDVIYKMEPVTVDIIKSNGQTIKAKDPRKNSIKVRNLLHWKWQQSNSSEDFELFYTRFTNHTLANMEMLIASMK